MPDEAKFRMLKSINWHEQSVCGLCANFYANGGQWGRCDRFDYMHTKHGDGPLGVHAYGVCDHFERDARRAETFLQSYALQEQKQKLSRQK